MQDPDRHAPDQEHNRRAWDVRVRKQQRFTRPVSDDDLRDPLKQIDAAGWLEDGLRGRDVLCLAAGGGRQAVLAAAAGARVTVVDISAEMLELDRQAAARHALVVQTVCASMDSLPMFAEAAFDVVLQPVSTCYVPDIRSVYDEVARVLRDTGLYISQHKTPTSLQADSRSASNGYELVEPYYRHGPLPQVSGSLHREDGTREFLHRWEQLIGELCQAGFTIEDLSVPNHADPHAAPGTFAHRSCYVPAYVRIKARRRDREQVHHQRPVLWTP